MCCCEVHSILVKFCVFSVSISENTIVDKWIVYKQVINFSATTYKFRKYVDVYKHSVPEYMNVYM